MQLKFAQAKHFEKNFSVCLRLRVKRSENLFQNQRSDAAGGVSIKALARQVVIKNLRCSIFSSDEAEISRARAHTYGIGEIALLPCLTFRVRSLRRSSCDRKGSKAKHGGKDEPLKIKAKYFCFYVAFCA